MKSILILVASLVHIFSFGQSLVGNYCFNKTTHCEDEKFIISSVDGINVEGVRSVLIDYECSYNHTTYSVSEFTGVIIGNKVDIQVSYYLEGYEENYSDSYMLYFCSDAIFIIIGEDTFRLNRCIKNDDDD